MKKFLSDFIISLLYMAFQGLYIVIDLAHSIISSTIKIMNNIVRPAVVELLADISMVLNVIWQSFLEVSSNVLLSISKITLSWSESLHNRAEQLLYKNWDI